MNWMVFISAVYISNTLAESCCYLLNQLLTIFDYFNVNHRCKKRPNLNHREDRLQNKLVCLHTQVCRALEADGRLGLWSGPFFTLYYPYCEHGIGNLKSLFHHSKIKSPNTHSRRRLFQLNMWTKAYFKFSSFHTTERSQTAVPLPLSGGSLRWKKTLPRLWVLDNFWKHILWSSVNY